MAAHCPLMREAKMVDRAALPALALSVRQPWAWAIVHGGKDVENRSPGSIRAGRMDCRPIAIHAATGMTQEEYEWAVWRFQQDGISLPRPDELVRRAIIGIVDVVAIVDETIKPWCDSVFFGGKTGLGLANPRAVDAVPAQGALGYFVWQEGGALSPSLPWMKKWDRPSGDDGTLSLFPDDAPRIKTPEKRPWEK
ncbi:MAG: hypothetical protein AAF737_02500 [Pseudomonadota bacterium]